MRATEVCSLRVKDFHIGTGRDYLHLGQVKGSNPTIRPLMPRLQPYCWSGSGISSLESSRFPSAVPQLGRVRYVQLVRHALQAGMNVLEANATLCSSRHT